MRILIILFLIAACMVGCKQRSMFELEQDRKYCKYTYELSVLFSNGTTDTLSVNLTYTCSKGLDYPELYLDTEGPTSRTARVIDPCIIWGYPKRILVCGVSKFDILNVRINEL